MASLAPNDAGKRSGPEIMGIDGGIPSAGRVATVLDLEQAGFRVLVGADNDAASVETHIASLGGLGYDVGRWRRR